VKKTGGRRGRFRLTIRVPTGAEWLVILLMILLDAVVLNQVFLWVFEIWLSGVPNQATYLDSYFQVRLWLFALFLGFGWLFEIYRLRALRAASDILSNTIAALLGSFIAFNLLVFFSRSLAALAYTFPRPIILLSTGVSIVALLCLRILFVRLFRPEPVIMRAIIVGDEMEGKRILKHFHRRGGLRFKIMGTFPADKVDELASFVIFRQIHEVIVTDPTIPLDAFWANIFYHRKLEPHRFHVRIVIDPKTSVANVGLKSLEDLPLVSVCSHPLSALQIALKRGFDIGFSLFAILVSSPAMLMAAIYVPLDTPGSIFYRQKRVGLHGKEYELIKFRSMPSGAERQGGPQISTKNDPRTTPFGRFIRRFGIDELPQFFLVLTGEMSVVGPRPERPFFVEKHMEFQGRRLSVRPGVTGLAAVNARYYLRLTDKVAYDYFYLDSYSLILDIKIVFQTVWVLLFESDKALEDRHHALDHMESPPRNDEEANSP
jgi:exopolysaccharide biosynthesis polyprenyl glycosylphosphotransferase